VPTAAVDDVLRALNSTPVRLRARADMRAVLEEAKEPKAWPSRTASLRWEARDVVVQVHPSQYGLDEILQVWEPYNWPELPNNTPEDKKDVEVTVQRSMSTHMPLFIEHVQRITGRTITTTYIDTHANALSNGMKPDGVHVVLGSNAAPACVVAFQELKCRRNAEHFDNGEMEHCVGFAGQLLDDEPVRTSMLTYLCDGHVIQFFRGDKKGVKRTDPMLLRGVGEKWLAALLTTPIESLGYPPSCRAAKFSGVRIQYDRLLGRGAYAVVFSRQSESSGLQKEKEKEDVVKVDNDESGRSVQGEFDALQQLKVALASLTMSTPLSAPTLPALPVPAKSAGPMLRSAHNHPAPPAPVPVAPPVSRASPTHPPLPPLPSNHPFVAEKMVPRDYELSDCRSALRVRWRGLTPVEYHRTTFHNLVDFLQVLHACGFAHTDLHPDNLVMRGEQIVAIDYGSMVPLYTEQTYRGSTVCASHRVLLALREDSRIFSVHPSDELHNLVRCAYMLLVPHSRRHYFEEALHSARGRGEFTAADWTLPEFWNKRLKGRIWEPMLQHADECDYAALKKDFEDIHLG
jgi:hypothetical protein